MAETNPNGANQYQLDPRQKLCWDLYINPKSETFSNALQSAIKAGYTPDYANQITVQDWFVGKIRRVNLFGKAEKVLEEMLEMPVDVQKVEGYGDDKETVVKTEPALVKIKQDTAKFVAERLGKDEGYSTRNEMTGKDGKDIPTPLLAFIEKKNYAISSNNSNTEDNGNEEENTSDTGRNISQQDNIGAPLLDTLSPER